MSACSITTHELLKESLEALRQYTTPIGSTYYKTELLHHQRNCNRCLSTLGIEVGRYPELDAEAKTPASGTDSGPKAPLETG